MAPPLTILVVAILGLVFGGVGGAVLGLVGGFLLVSLIGAGVRKVQGGLVPAAARRTVVTNLLTGHAEAVADAYPDLEGDALFRTLESDVERILRRAVSISPTHDAVFSQANLFRAAAEVGTSESHPARQELYAAITARLMADWYQ